VHVHPFGKIIVFAVKHRALEANAPAEAAAAAAAAATAAGDLS